MSGLNLLLRHSKDYERTHQIILYTLLKQPGFVKLAFGFEEINYEVLWEFQRGTFDLGLGKDKNTPVVLIELKQHASLSQIQLNKQVSFLEEKNIRGYHILLGASDFEFIKNDNWCELSNKTNGRSQKIGTFDLIKILREYQLIIGSNRDLNELVVAYILLLEQQYKYLENAFSMDDVNDHFKFYSIYKKIQNRISGFYAKIYTVNNQGGASRIINDIDSWFPITYKNNTFQIYHEIFNGEYQIRMFSKTKDNVLIKELQSIIIEKLRESEFHRYDLKYSGNVSKYTILARKPFDLCDSSEFNTAVEIFSNGHKWLNELCFNLQ